MLSEHMTVETGDTRLSRRFSSTVQGHLRSLEKGEAKKCPNYIKAETAHLRMIDLNLFRVFDVMMLHRSVRKASQLLSVTPSAVSHALSRLRQSIGDELFIPTESGMQPTQRALQLASGVREGLEKLERALTRNDAVPAEALRTFRVGQLTIPVWSSCRRWSKGWLKARRKLICECFLPITSSLFNSWRKVEPIS